MPLSDTAIRAAKPKEKTYLMTDGEGMYLEITPAGGKWWRFKFRFDGKQKRLSLGTYPDTGLKEAREKRQEARRLLAAGVDPSENRKAQKAAGSGEAANSFEVIAREWFGRQASTWVPSHADKIISRLERDLFPWLGRRPISAITAPELLSVLRRIEDRGAVETAHRALQNCGQIFRYAIATGRADRDPSPALRGALAPVKQTHYPAVTDPKKIAALLRAMDSYEGTLVTKCALRLSPLVFVRPGELRGAEWSEFDLEGAEWTIPASRMKMGVAHLVPLSTQAIAILEEVQALTGNGRFVFPSARTTDRPMSDNAVLAALRRMGFAKEEMTGHGFRAMARTILDEVLQVRPDYIEHQLAHAVRDPNGRAYNRTAHLAERRKMMQLWADYLDKIKAETNVIPFKALNSPSNETGDSVAIHQGEPQKRRGIEGRPVSQLFEEMRLSAESHAKEAATKPTTNSKVSAPTGEAVLSEVGKQPVYSFSTGEWRQANIESTSNQSTNSIPNAAPKDETAISAIVKKQMFGKGFGYQKEGAPEDSINQPNTQQAKNSDQTTESDEKPQ